jgi:hypothetical protein
MTIRGTLGLAVLLALLVAYLVATPPPAGPERDATALLTPPLDGATRIEIAQAGRVTELVRRDGRWNVPGVPDLLDALASLRVLAVIDPGTDPASYGFGADAMRLRVSAEGRELVAIEVGAMNPAETGVYVRRSTQRPVLLIGALLRWELEKVRRVVSETATP